MADEKQASLPCPASHLQSAQAGTFKLKTTCEVEGCKAKAAVQHHNDYQQPLRTISMCNSHHRKIHNGSKRLKTKPGASYRFAYAPPTF